MTFTSFNLFQQTFEQENNWKTKEVYKILDFDSEDINEDKEFIGQFLPSCKEEIVKEISQKHYEKVQQLHNLYIQGVNSGLIVYSINKHLFFKNVKFVPYSKFLDFHNTNFVFTKKLVKLQRPIRPLNEPRDYHEYDSLKKQFNLTANLFAITGTLEVQTKLNDIMKRLELCVEYEKALKQYWEDEKNYDGNLAAKSKIENANYYDYHPNFLDFFKNLSINSQEKYDDFCKKYPPNLKGYLQLLGESKAEKIRTFFLQKPLWAFITSQERARHTFITGMSGSGKSELLKFMTYADLIKDNMNHHIVLLDPNGDLAEQTVKMAIAADFPTEDIIYIDPILFTDATPCLNPLQIEDKSETNIDRMSQELSGVFQSIIKLEGNLSLQMQALIIPCLSTLLREGDSSFTDLQNFMSEEKQAPYIRLGQQSPLPTHRSFFASAFSETGYKPTKQSLYTKLQTLLNSPTFVNLSVGVPTIDLPEILNSKRAKLIVFNLSKGSIGSDVSEALGRFILATISTIGMQRSKISENQRMPVYAIVDEFQNYVGGNTIKEGLAELRKYKIAYTLACQYAGQLDTDTQKAVFNNSSIKIIGQQQDPTSIATLSKITGASTDEIKELAPRQFILKRGHAKYLPITVPNIAHKKHQSISKMEWEAFLAYQKEHYYKPLINDVNAAEKWERIKHHDDIPRPKAAPKFKNY